MRAALRGAAPAILASGVTVVLGCSPCCSASRQQRGARAAGLRHRRCLAMVFSLRCCPRRCCISGRGRSGRSSRGSAGPDPLVGPGAGSAPRRRRPGPVWLAARPPLLVLALGLSSRPRPGRGRAVRRPTRRGRPARRSWPARASRRAAARPLRPCSRTPARAGAAADRLGVPRRPSPARGRARARRRPAPGSTSAWTVDRTALPPSRSCREARAGGGEADPVRASSAARWRGLRHARGRRARQPRRHARCGRRGAADPARPAPRRGTAGPAHRDGDPSFAARSASACWLRTSSSASRDRDQLPLIAFVFLVALGVDYNIFLVARAREDAAEHGTARRHAPRARVTGGVITSAGVLLAGTLQHPRPHPLRRAGPARPDHRLRRPARHPARAVGDRARARLGRRTEGLVAPRAGDVSRASTTMEARRVAARSGLRRSSRLRGAHRRRSPRRPFAAAVRAC